MLSFFSASNEIVNSKSAMTDCLTRALESENSTDCDLVVIHATIAHDFRALLDAAHSLAPSATVLGCTGAGVIGKEGASEKMRALGVMAVKGPRNEFVAGYRNEIRGYNSFEVARDIATELKAKNAGVNFVNILASGIDIAANEAIRGIESVFGEGFPIIGGTSSDNNKARSNYQFFGTEIMERGAILLGFADPGLEVTMMAHHGNTAIGMPFEVTASEANRVFELDGKTAYPYLMDTLNLPHDTDLADSIAISCLAELAPEELHEEYDNKHLPRVIIQLDEQKRSIFLPVAVPVGTKLWLVQRDEDLIFAGLDRLMERLTTRLDGRRPIAVFHTDCSARGRLMFNNVLKDEIIAKMQYPLHQGEPIPWLGIYGFGEFCQLGGQNFFHNQTTSIYALTRKTD
jgi:hypothetical protein